MQLTDRQKRLLGVIDSGGRVEARPRQGDQPFPKNWTFYSDEDGYRAPLYLSMTAGALIRKGVLTVRQTPEGAILCRTY